MTKLRLFDFGHLKEASGEESDAGKDGKKQKKRASRNKVERHSYSSDGGTLGRFGIRYFCGH